MLRSVNVTKRQFCGLDRTTVTPEIGLIKICKNSKLSFWTLLNI